MPTLRHATAAFGLAFDIEKTPAKRSGFRPADFDLGSGKSLFGDLRLDGFASALRIGFAERLVLVGGDEGRYRGETPVINRAEAIREMLIADHGIDADRVQAYPSRSNTGGNIEIIRRMVSGSDARQFAVLTSHYHLPRAQVDMRNAGLGAVAMFSAESFWLMEDMARKNELIERLGGGPLAERDAEEVQGIAEKIRGTYVARTDAAATGLEIRQKA